VDFSNAHISPIEKMQLKYLLIAQAITTEVVHGFGYLKSRNMSPVLRPQAVKRAAVYGPLVLKGKDEPKTGGFSLDPKGQGGTYRITQNPCFDVAGGCTVLSAHWRLEYADTGKQATPSDGVYIHHLTASDTTKSGWNAFPGGGLIGGGAGRAYFGDRGEDSGETSTIFTSSTNKTSTSGFHLGAKDAISVQTDLVNYDSKSKNLNMVLEVEYLPGFQGKDTVATLKSAGAGGLGKINLNGQTPGSAIRANQNIKIIWARGHLHAGGEKMLLKLDGAVKCTSVPTYDKKNVITDMSLCPEIHVSNGQSLVVEAYYNTKAHPLRESTDGKGGGAHTVIGGSDVMGMFAFTYEKA